MTGKRSVTLAVAAAGSLAVALGACSPSQADQAPAATDEQPATGEPPATDEQPALDTVQTVPAYTVAGSTPQGPARVFQVRIDLPDYAPERSVIAIADRVRDSVAAVHPDLWAIEMLFRTRDSVTDERLRVAELVWGPDGEKDRSGSLTGPHAWDRHYLPETRHTVLGLLSDYGYTLGEKRATVMDQLGPPDSVTTGPGLFGMDTTFALAYPEGVVHVSRANVDGIELMGRIRAWGGLAGLPQVVVPGVTSRSDLLGMLGQPRHPPWAVADSTVLTYPGGGWATELIDFYLVGDTVRVIAWRFRMG